MKEEHWNEVFIKEDINILFKVIDDSKGLPQMKPTIIKFLGNIIYQDQFSKDLELVEYIINTLYTYRNETNMQVCLK